MTAVPALALAAAANAVRVRLSPRLYLWVCDRLYHEAAFAYDWVAALVSAGRWRGWTERAGRGLAGRVAEIGPGTGHLLAEMRGGGTAAVALELSPAMAARAAALSPGAVARGDARALPFRTQSLDALVVTFPGPYVRDPAFWREAARVLRIGGRMRVLLDAGPSYATRGAWSIDAPTAGWRLRRARVGVGSATLGFYLARRIAPERPLRPPGPRARRTRRRRLAPPTDFPGGASGPAQASL
ncbi:MAG TPA: methyltransferase domain-containing protein [Chloroflexota bacterium]|jgi:SAM-dependent methyltransferase